MVTGAPRHRRASGDDVPADKDAARRRRQARNRQERVNRQKRIEGARRSESTRPTPGAPAPAPPTRPARSASTTAAAVGGLRSRIFPPRATPAPKGPAGRPSRSAAAAPPRRSSDADADEVEVADSTVPAKGRRDRSARAQPRRSEVVDVGPVSGLRGEVQRRCAQPGGRPALLALFVAAVFVIGVALFPVAPRFVLEGYGRAVVEASDARARVQEARLDRFTEADPTFASDHLFRAYPPLVAAVLALVPLALAAVAVTSLTRPTRSRTLLITAMGGFVYVFFTGIIGTYFLLGVIALGFAAYRSRKADVIDDAKVDAG